jgi:pilus assembly protein Flp/PilA
MNHIIANLSVAIRRLLRESGQDLVEYALIVALIAFSAVAGMQTLAGDINSAFSTLGTDMTSASA